MRHVAFESANSNAPTPIIMPRPYIYRALPWHRNMCLCFIFCKVFWQNAIIIIHWVWLAGWLYIYMCVYIWSQSGMFHATSAAWQKQSQPNQQQQQEPQQQPRQQPRQHEQQSTMVVACCWLVVVCCLLSLALFLSLFGVCMANKSNCFLNGMIVKWVGGVFQTNPNKTKTFSRFIHLPFHSYPFSSFFFFHFPTWIYICVS